MIWVNKKYLCEFWGYHSCVADDIVLMGQDTALYHGRTESPTNRQFKYNVTLRRFSATIIAVEKMLHIYSECVFIALCIQNATRMRNSVLCSLSGCTNLPTLFQKGHEFRRKKNIESKIYVLIFSTNLSEIYWSLCKVPFILVTF
jgi:hypothetical protein